MAYTRRRNPCGSDRPHRNDQIAYRQDYRVIKRGHAQPPHHAGLARVASEAASFTALGAVADPQRFERIVNRARSLAGAYEMNP